MGGMFGPSAVEGEAQKYRQDFGASLPGYMNQGMDWMNKGMGQLDTVNGQINNYMSGLGKDPTTLSMQSYLNDVMTGKSRAAQGSAGQGVASQASAYNLGMQGNSFAQQFGSDLGGLALQQQNMQRVADKLSSTDQNPFAVLSKGAMEDAAYQNAQGRDQLQSQLASQGLGGGSGTGAAALAALQFNTNKQVSDAYRQNAVQGAQFQQQGLGMAGGLYGQMAGLDLQRATTQGQLGLGGYQADISNAGRYDAVNMANAQMQTQTSNSNAALQTQASLQNAGMQNDWAKMGVQGQMQMIQQLAAQQMAGYGLLSQNAGQTLGAGQNMWGQAFNGQQNYMGSLNQMAGANAQGRSDFWGGLIGSGLGMAGTLLTGMPMFGGKR